MGLWASLVNLLGSGPRVSGSNPDRPTIAHFLFHHQLNRIQIDTKMTQRLAIIKTQSGQVSNTDITSRNH